MYEQIAREAMILYTATGCGMIGAAIFFSGLACFRGLIDGYVHGNYKNKFNDYCWFTLFFCISTTVTYAGAHLIWFSIQLMENMR